MFCNYIYVVFRLYILYLGCTCCILAVHVAVELYMCFVAIHECVFRLYMLYVVFMVTWLLVYITVCVVSVEI